MPGLLYFLLITLVPAIALLYVWRNTRPDSWAFVGCLLTTPVVVFVFGGMCCAIFVEQHEATGFQADEPPWPLFAWFLFGGTLSAAFCVASLICCAVGLAVCRVIAAETYFWMTERIR